MSRTACIILNYNDAETAISLLEIIKEFDCFEYIVVVDNMSKDNSYRKLKQYESNKIHVILTDRNGGYGFGNNVGIRYCKESLKMDYCVIANPDVIFSHSFICALIKYMDKHNLCALVSGMQSGSGASAWRETSVFGDVIFNCMLLNKIIKPRYYPVEYYYRKECEVYAIPGCLFLARIEALYDIGLYDEEFFLFEEEKVIAKKLKNRKWKSVILTDYTYIHNHSVSIKKSIRRLGQGKRLVLQSNELYLKKYCGVKGFAMQGIKVFYFFCVLESIIYSLYRRIKK